MITSAMHQLRHIFRTSQFILLTFILAAPVLAQQEAESATVIEYQHKRNKKRSVIISPGSTIQYPVYDGTRLRHRTGTVTQIEDSVLTVAENRSMVLREIDVARIPYIKHVKKGRRTWGLVLLGVGLGIGLVTWGISAAIFLSSVAVYGGGETFLILVATFFGSMLNYTSITGFILYLTSITKLWARRWTFRPRNIVKILRKK